MDYKTLLTSVSKDKRWYIVLPMLMVFLFISACLTHVSLDKSQTNQYCAGETMCPIGSAGKCAVICKNGSKPEDVYICGEKNCTTSMKFNNTGITSLTKLANEYMQMRNSLLKNNCYSLRGYFPLGQFCVASDGFSIMLSDEAKRRILFNEREAEKLLELFTYYYL